MFGIDREVMLHPRSRILGDHWYLMARRAEVYGSPSPNTKQNRCSVKEDCSGGWRCKAIAQEKGLVLSLPTGSTAAHIVKKIEHQLTTQSPPCL